MTDWANIKQLGIGVVDFRLMIEGWPHEWTTSTRITHLDNSDGRIVYPGLQYSGLRISERSVMRDSWPQVGGITATICPVDGIEDTLLGFTRDSRAVGILLDNLDSTDIAWSTRPELPSGTYHIATETLVHEGGNFISRGHWQTLGQAHSITEGALDNPVPIYTWPPTMEGRRAFLYVYGAGDDPDGDGTCIWRGVVSRPPRMNQDGVSWSIQIDPITTIFEQTVGGGQRTEYKIRGVYHSNQCPLSVAIFTRDPGTINGPQVKVHGFFETQDEWSWAVSTAMVGAVAAATGDAGNISFITHGHENGVPYFLVVMDASTHEFGVGLHVIDALDGCASMGSPGDPAPNGEPGNVLNAARNSLKLYYGQQSGEFYSMGWDPAPYGYPLPPARTMVGDLRINRSIPNASAFEEAYTAGDPANSYPPNRIYLESVEGLVVGQKLVARNEGSNTFLTIDSIDSSDGERWIEVSIQQQNPTPLYLTSESVLIPVADYGTNSNWALFAVDVGIKAVFANLGTTPYITLNDFEAVNWAALSIFYPLHWFWKRRSYQFIKETKVKDILIPEWMGTGFMGRVSAEGKLDVTPFPVITPQRTAQHSIVASDILAPAEGMYGAFPMWEAQPEGIVNTVTLRFGYSPVEDEFDESLDFIVRQTTSIAEHKGVASKEEIAPKSTPTAQEVRINLGLFGVITRSAVIRSPPASDIAAMVDPYLRTMSEDYALITISVAYNMFDVLCGDIVEVTSELVPNGQGGRGVTAKKYVCVGREWDLDPKSNRMGTLTLWAPRDSGKRAGYAPTGRITAQSGSGTTWTLTFSTANARNIAWSEDSDGDIVKHFAVGDLIVITQVDTTSPTIRNGTVSFAAGDQIGVTLLSSWTPGANTWNLRFGFPGETTLPERQNAYCWIADEDGVLIDGSAGRSFL